MTFSRVALVLSLAAVFAGGCNSSQHQPPGEAVGSTSAASTSNVVSASYQFNGTTIKAGQTIWFSSVFKVNGSLNAPAHLVASSGTITLPLNGVMATLSVPDAVVTLDPSVTSATTSIDSNNHWQTSAPTQYAGNGFLSGFAFVAPYNIPGGATVTWTATLSSDTPNLDVNWQWGAAVYSQFGASGAAQAKACDDNHFTSSSDPAGTPEAYRQYVIGGAGGGGGSNYTGGLSGTFRCSPILDRCLDLVACPAPTNVCQVQGVCQPSTGTCSTPAAPNGTSCPMVNAIASCQSGACTRTACVAGYGDCNGNCNQSPTDGCETPTNTTSNCNGCGVQCWSGPNSVPTCTASGCGIACVAGYGNCDGNSVNGCETNVFTNVNDCGACGNVCAAGARCTNGSCVDQLPGVPTITSVTVGNGQASVAFTAPSTNGGSPITAYTVTSSPGGLTATGTSSPIVIAGLTDGTSYTFTITATNAVGTSAASRPSSTTTIPLFAPGAPAISSVTAGNGRVSVAFTAPSSNGGAAITTYTVTSAPGGLKATGAESPLAVTGLTDGTAYTFTVTATNSVGTGPASAPSASSTPAGPPGAPGTPQASAGNGTATVTFGAAASNGSAITSYTVTSSPGGVIATGPGSPLTVSGLTDGVAYTFTVTASNGQGMGPASSSSSAVTPTGPPGAPTITTVTNGNGQATIAFNPSTFTGGLAVSAYTVTSSPGALTATGSASPLTVTGLTDGTSYTFTVTARNTAGTSPPSASSGSDVPLGPPGAPSITSASAGNGQATVAFTPPASNGGSAITSYSVTSSPGGVTGTGATSPIVVSPLSDGVSYTFTVVASNGVGTSSASAASAAVTPIGAPAAPAITSVAAGAGTATVAFTTPASNGSPVTSYTVTSIPGGFTATGAASPLVVGGLTDGQSYTFTVTATNAAGTSAASSPSSNGVVPAGAPGAPAITGVTPSDGSASVAFSAPASNGAAITSYTVTSSGGQVGTGASSPILVSGLVDGAAYTFTVTATNAAGTGSASAASSSVIPVGPPGAPAITSVAVASTASAVGQATVSFTAGASNGAPITSYTVTSSPGGQTATGSSSPLVITGLTDGTSYTFTVVATSAAGSSPASPQSAPQVASGPPAAPSISTLTPSDGATTVSFLTPNSGGSPITSYEVLAEPGDILVTGTSSPITVTGLTDGTSYTFTVTATSGLGISPPSAASSPETPTGPPGSPAITSLTAGDGTVTVAFSAPSSTGGLPIGYTVIAQPGGASVTGASSPLTITGLTDGTPYSFTVLATNADGSGAPSANSPASGGLMPGVVPQAPSILGVVPQDGAAVVSFSAPYNGGLPITAYTVTTVGGGVVTGSASPITVSGLTDGQAYTFTVSATNSAGQGPASAASVPAIPAGLPGAPSITSVAAAGHQASVAFSTPSSGGSNILSYTVTSTPGGVTATGTSSPITVPGLTDGTSYTFTVYASNALGNSPLSTPSGQGVVPLDPPGAPVIVGLAGSDGQVVVTLSLPASNGGTPVLGYTVTSSPGGLTGSAPVAVGSTPVTVAGLTDGQAYTFTATATNAVGVSAPSSASPPVTPSAPPGAPTITDVTVGDGSATIDFTASSFTGGFPVTQFTMTASPGGSTVSGAASPLTLTGLVDGTTYMFTITATNAVGTSAPNLATSAPVTPVGPPQAPVIIAGSVVPSNESVSLSFTTDGSTGGLPIDHYTVVAMAAGHPSVMATVSTSPISVGNLINGVTYSLSVTATNTAGITSLASTPVQATPKTNPDAPTITNVVASAGAYSTGSAAVYFALPTNNGGFPISSYTVTASSPDAPSVTATGSKSPVVVNNLVNGDAYTFTVVATSCAQPPLSSAPSTASSPPSVPIGLASPPDSGSFVITTGDRTATITWNAPADGGAPIQSYTVSTTDGSFSISGVTGTSVTFYGLADGTVYQVQVESFNQYGGSGPSASSAPFVPSGNGVGGPPCAPSFNAYVSGGGTYLVVLLNPQSCDNGANGWSVSLSPADSTGSGSGSESNPIYVYNLNPGTIYSVNVVASNAVGKSGPGTQPAIQAIIATYSANNPNIYIDAINGNIIDPSFNGAEYDAQSGSSTVQNALNPAPLVVFVGAQPLQGSNSFYAFVLTQDPNNNQTPTSYFGTSVDPNSGIQLDQYGDQLDNVNDPIYFITTDGALFSASTSVLIDPITGAAVSGLGNQVLNTPSAYSLSGYSALY